MVGTEMLYYTTICDDFQCMKCTATLCICIPPMDVCGYQLGLGDICLHNLGNNSVVVA